MLVWYRLLTDTIYSSSSFTQFNVWGLRMCWHQDEMKVAVEERRGGGEKGDSGRQINILQSLRSSLQLPMQPYTTVPHTGHWKHDSYCWKCCYMPMNSQTLWHPYSVCQKGNKRLLERFTSNFICSIYARVVPLIHDAFNSHARKQPQVLPS